MNLKPRGGTLQEMLCERITQKAIALDICPDIYTQNERGALSCSRLRATKAMAKIKNIGGLA